MWQSGASYWKPWSTTNVPQYTFDYKPYKFNKYNTNTFGHTEHNMAPRNAKRKRTGSALIGPMKKKMYKVVGGRAKASGGSSLANKTTSRYRATAQKKIKGRKRFTKRQRQFYKKVKNIVDGEDGVKHIIRTPFVAGGLQLSFLVNQQQVYGLTIGACRGTAGQDDDLGCMFDASFGATVDEESWITVKGGIVHYTILNENTGTNILDIDIYEVMCIKDLPLAQSNTNISDFFKSEVSAQQATGITGGTQLQSTTAGVNPFTVGGTFGKYFKMTRHKKVYLPPGEAMDDSLAMKWNKKIIGDEVGLVTGLLAKKGVTKGLLFFVNNVKWVVGTAGAAGLLNYHKKYTYIATGSKTHSGGQI